MAPRLQHFFSRLPLQTVLTIPFVIQTIAVVSVVGYLSFKNGQSTAQDLSSQLRKELIARIQQQLLVTVERPYIINKINANSLQQGDIDVLTGQGENQLWQQAKVFPSTNLLYCATESDGAFLGVGRSNGGTGQSLQAYIANPETERLIFSYGIDDFGDRTALQTKGDKIYDPRLRPWYEAAKNEGGPTWSKIYLDFETSLPTITAATPIYTERTNQLKGVCATDIILSEELNEFLRGLEVSKTGIAYIIEPSGTLIATSTPDPITSGAVDRIQLLSAYESRNPLIRYSMQFLDQEYESLEAGISEEKSFYFDGDLHYLEVLQFNDGLGLNWIVILVVPEDDFMEQIDHNSQVTVLLSVLALFITIAIGFLITQWLTRPLIDLNEKAKEMARGKWHEPVELDRGDVIGDLSRSFAAMAHQLRESFNLLEKRIEERTAELQDLNQELQRLANNDGLTQVANRRYFDHYLEKEWKDLIRKGNPLSLILCDVDFFKKYNDTYGHQAGDLCLQQVAQVLKSSVHQTTDLVARYGGEEFAIVLSNTDQEGALHVAQVIFNKLAKLSIAHRASEAGVVTVSMGIATVMPTASGNLRSLLTATDLALYAAKSRGRNQYCVASQSLEEHKHRSQEWSSEAR